MTNLGYLLVFIIFGMPVFMVIAYFLVLRWSLDDSKYTEEEKKKRSRRIRRFSNFMD